MSYPIPHEDFILKIPFSYSMTWKEILEIYPNVKNELDGSCEENSFTFYYEYSPVSCEYLFKDEDSENDLAEIFGIDLYAMSTGEEKEEELSRKDNQLRCKSLEEYINNLEEIIEVNKKETKLAKKERRKLKLEERKLKTHKT